MNVVPQFVIDDIAELLTSELGTGVEPVVEACEEAWDPIEQRTIVRTTTSAWSTLTTIDVLVDAFGDPVGFEDAGAWRGCGHAAIDDADLLALIERTELVDGPLRLLQRGTGAQDSITVTVGGADGARVEAVVNPARRRIISLQPHRSGGS